MKGEMVIIHRPNAINRPCQDRVFGGNQDGCLASCVRALFQPSTLADFALLDEAAEGRIEALEALEAKQAGASEAENEAERDEFDAALAKVKELAERKATLRIEAIEALNALPGGNGGDSATAPLLTNAAVNLR